MQVYFLNSLPEFGQPYYIYYLKTDGKYYGWDSQNNKFYNLSTPNINDLVGLNFENLQEGDVLSYDSASQTWINKVIDKGVSYERLSDFQFPYQYSGNAPLETPETSSLWIINRIDFSTPGYPITLQATGPWVNRYSLIYL
jgi:hypothetical protein